MTASIQFAPFYPIIHRVLKPLFPTCLWSGNDRYPYVALTFDDGPHPVHTLQLLKVLDRHQVKASFFGLGVLVERFPEIVRAIYDQGHWLALHGYNHYAFTALTDLELRNSLQRTQQAISEICQLSPASIRDVRPPNGLFLPKTLNLLTQWNYRPVMWSVVPEDWVYPGTDVVIRRILHQAKNGAIIVLHDGYYGGEAVAHIANQVIPLLQAQGYQFVSIDQLWQST